MIRVGVIGYGYWGPNLVRNFNEVDDCEMVWVSDLDQELLVKAKRRFPGIEVTSDHRELVAGVDAVVIATPVSTHFPLALEALQAGKHVWVEKPIAETSDEARRLLDEARDRELVLHVDHTFCYTGAVKKIRELVEGGTLGDLQYFDSVRINLGLFQHDVNVLWDLAVHDLSIMDYILPNRPKEISATGVSHVSGEPENTAYLTLFFDDDFIAHIHANWLAPVKTRRTLLCGTKKMIVYDDLEATEKIKIYDKGITAENHPENRKQMLIGYRTGDMWSPRLEVTEALAEEVAHFRDCVMSGSQSITNGEVGLRVVRELEAATESMKKQGRPVRLDLEG